MKFPTSVFSTSPTMQAEVAGDPEEMFREAAQAKIDEPVIAACGFARQGMMTNKLAGHFGALPYAIARKRQQMRAGGLPEHFILAVTAERVYALERKIKMREYMGEIGEEVACWDRAGLRVCSKPDRTVGGMGLNVTIESPAEGEAVHCSVGRAAQSEEFLRLLGGAGVGA
jgi:hypothetical protein